jgi:hypothetical protein
MAKGSSDVILRDRLQFDIDANGDTSLVYGRIDLSDYVSIPQNKGLAIKEIRFMLRSPTFGNGEWPPVMLQPHVSSSFSALGNRTMNRRKCLSVEVDEQSLP